MVGIGGSYLGARAAIELLCTPSHNRISGGTEVYFCGNTLSPDAVNELLAVLGDRDFSVNVVSKSGGTLEPALGFRVAKQLLERKYGRNTAKKHIFATTDAHKGKLYNIAKSEDYEMFVVPDDVGGRFSVLSAVGLLPMAVAGIDVQTILDKAIETFHDLDLRSPENPAWQYAAARQNLYSAGKSIEILACYEPSFRFMAEWWKQLFGESEGKNGIGIYPASVEYNADLHSMGQYIQDGSRTLMETVVSFDKCRTEYKIPFEMGDPDGLNYLAGKDFGEISRIAMEAVKQAHIAGGVHPAGVGVVGRDIPAEARRVHGGVEPQVLCGVIHPPGAVEPDALHVERHVNLVAGVGIIAVQPDFVVGRVDALHPYLVDQHIGLNLVIVAAINHQLLLGVEVLYGAMRL